MESIQAAETDFLREFADTYVSEISYDESEIGAQLEKIRSGGLSVGLADVLYVLRHGIVVASEKEAADGANWFVEGETCHDYKMVMELKVWCDLFRVRVLHVDILGENNG